MKYLAIDYGQKRTGLAVSDPEERMAFPRATLAMRGKDAFFAELLALAESEGIRAFVVGLPLRSNSEDSETTRQARTHGRPPGPPHRSARVPHAGTAQLP